MKKKTITNWLRFGIISAIFGIAFGSLYQVVGHNNQYKEVRAETGTMSFAQTSTSAGNLTGAPEGITASFTTTYTNKEQLTKGNSMSLTLSVGDNSEYLITSIVLSMRNNTSKGNGSVSVKIADVDITKSFTPTGFGATYGDKELEMNDAAQTEVFKNGSNLVITIASTENSVYCNRFDVGYKTYEAGGPTVTTVKLSAADQSIDIDDTEGYAPVVKEKDTDNVITGCTFTTDEAGEKIVNIDDNNLLWPVAPGEATITVTKDSDDPTIEYQQTTFKLTVTVKNLVEYTLTAEDVELDVSDEDTPVTVKNGTGDNAQEVEGVTLESGDEDVVTIVDGKLHPVAKGTATITMSKTSDDVHIEYKNGTFGVTVNDANDMFELAEMAFGSSEGRVNINGASITGNDSHNNEWTITTNGTTSFSPNASYSQIGSKNAPASSITFETTFANKATIKQFQMNFGGFSGTEASISVTLDDTEIASGSLNGASDVTVSQSEGTAQGKDLKVIVTNIARGVKVYGLSYKYYETILAEKDITIDTTNVKKEFEQGDTFTYEGLVVNVVYEDDSSSQLTTGYTVSEPNMMVAGEQTITVTYGEFSKTYTITISEVAEAFLMSIAVKTLPNKVTYTAGEELDLTGLVITATYSDESTQDITAGYTHSSPNMETKGEKEVTITYEGKETSFNITVNLQVLTVSEVIALMEEAGNPTTALNNGRKYIIQGYFVSSSGWSDKYSNGNVFIADDPLEDDTANLFEIYRCGSTDVYNAVVGTKIEVECAIVYYTNGKIVESNGAPDRVEIIQEAPVIVLSISATLAKTQYQLGEELQFASFSVTTNYEENKALTADEVTISEVDMSTAGNKQVTVSYGDKSVVLNFTVADYLGDAQTAAKAELNAIDTTVYSEANKTAIEGIIAQAISDIDAATTADAVNSILTTAKAAIAEYKTAAVELSEAKENAKDELGNYKLDVLEDYDDAEQWDLVDLVIEGKEAIDNCTTVEEVAAVLADYKAQMDAVLTHDQKVALALQNAKDNAKAELANYKNLDNYRQEQKTQLEGIILEGQGMIDLCETVNEVNQALAAYKQSMDAVKTDAELTAEELAAAKATAKQALEDYVDLNDYRDAEAEQLMNMILAGQDAIDACETIEAVNTKLAEVKAQMDEVKTDAELTAEEAAAALATAKTNAKAELENYKNLSEYREVQQQELTNLINSGKEAIDACETIEAVNTKLAEVKTQMDAVKKANEYYDVTFVIADDAFAGWDVLPTDLSIYVWGEGNEPVAWADARGNFEEGTITFTLETGKVISTVVIYFYQGSDFKQSIDLNCNITTDGNYEIYVFDKGSWVDGGNNFWKLAGLELVDLNALANAKADAKAELDALNQPENYREAEQAQLETLVNNGKAAIDACRNVAQVNTKLTEAKEAIAALKTAAQYEAEELATAKVNAKAELDTYLDKDLYRDAQKAEIDDIINTAKGLIDECTSIDDVEDIYLAALDDLDAVKTDAELTAEEAAAALAQAKTNAKAELDSYKTMSDYREAEQQTLAGIIANGKAAIDACETIESVNTKLAEVKALMDAVKTDAELTAEEEAQDFEEVKTNAKQALANYKNLDNYRQEQKTQLEGIILEGQGMIDLCETVNEVNQALAAYKQSMDAVKTDAELTAEEAAAALAQAKTAAKQALEDYVDFDDYRDAEEEQLMNMIIAGQDAIDACETIEAVNAKLAEVKAQMDVVKTDAELTAEELAAAKANAKAALETYKTMSDYREAEQQTLAGIIADGKTAIDACATIEAVNAKLAEVKAQMDVVKTDAELTAEEAAAALAQAKTTAKAELDAYKTTSDYREAEQQTLAGIIANGKTAIDACETIEAVNTKLAEVKGLMDAVKTDAELTAEELADAKADAKAELDAYKTMSDYREAEQQTLAGIIANGKTAIDACETIEAVNTKLAEVKGLMDAVKTDAELTAEELAAAKAAAKEYLLLTEDNFYMEDNYEYYLQQYAYVCGLIDNATSTQAVAYIVSQAVPVLEGLLLQDYKDYVIYSITEALSSISYLPSDLETAMAIYNEGIEAIQAATTKAEVNAAAQAMIAEISQVPTYEDRLAEYKEYVIGILVAEDTFPLAQLTDANILAEFLAAREDAVAAIQDAEDFDTVMDVANGLIDFFNDCLLRNARGQILAILDQYYIEDNYLPDDWAVLVEIKAAFISAMNEAETMDELYDVLEEYAELLDEVPTKLYRAYESAYYTLTATDLSIYREAQQQEIINIVNSALSSMAKCTIVEQINALLAAAQEAIAEVKTDAELTAEELVVAKYVAKNALDSYKKESDYREAELLELQAIIANGKEAIDACATIEEVEAKLAEIKAQMDAVKTNADYEAEALAEAKANAKAELAAYKDMNEYRAAEQAELQALIASGSDAIDGCSTIEQVNMKLNMYKNKMDAVKTDAELTAEELVVAKANAIEEVVNYLDRAKYFDNELGIIDFIITEAQAAIEGAVDIASVQAELAAAKELLDAVKTAVEITIAEVQKFYDELVANGAYTEEGLAELEALLNRALNEIRRAGSAEGLQALAEQYMNKMDAVEGMHIPVIPSVEKSIVCGGSVMATSGLLALLSLIGIGALSLKKRKEN